MTKRRTVLVTGGSGFVGTHLIRELLADGFDVRSTSRTGRAAVDDPRLRTYSIDLSEEHPWDEALEGVECVVHLAAQVHLMNPTAEDRRRFHEVNVIGTERLAAAAIRARVPRVILLSSVKVNGESTHGMAFGAFHKPQPADEYGVSKMEAENALLRVSDGQALKAIAIRSPLVYGPGVRANFLRLMSWVKSGVPLPFASISNRRSLVSVWNLTSLIRRAIDIKEPPTGVFMVSDGQDLSTPELIKHLAAAMGRRPALIPLPPKALLTLGKLVGYSGELERLLGSLIVDIDETKRRLDWEPVISVADGIARTAHWFVNEGKGRIEK